jgi:hypothetical protein
MTDEPKPRMTIKGLAPGVDPASLVNETHEVFAPFEVPPNPQGFDSSDGMDYGAMGSMIRNGLTDERASRRVPAGLAYLAVVIGVGALLLLLVVSVVNVIGSKVTL